MAGLGGLALLACVAGRGGDPRHEEAHSLRASISAIAAADNVATVDPCRPNSQKGGCYEETSEGVPGYTKHGIGYCSAGFYAGLWPPEAVDLATCSKKCSSESRCKFFSFALGQTCSRYSSAAGPCDLYANDVFAASHRTYAKLVPTKLGTHAQEGQTADIPSNSTEVVSVPAATKDNASEVKSAAGNATDGEVARAPGHAGATPTQRAAENSTNGTVSNAARHAEANASKARSTVTAGNATDGTAAGTTNHTAANGTHRSAGNSTNDTTSNSTSDEEVTTTTTTTMAAPAYLRHPLSLYCWLLARAKSYEAELVRRSYYAHQGVFACDGFDVLGDYWFWIGKGISITAIGDVTSKPAPWGSVLNVMPFLRAWDKVIELQHYWEYSWTVKVDPDTAFMPERLRWHLSGKPAGTACWIKNWDASFGLLGAIEIFSAVAVREFGKRKSECISDGKDLKSAGEDGFMATCFGEDLKFSGLQDAGVLDSCTDVGHCYWEDGAPAVHPFKNPDTLSQCLAAMVQAR